MRRAFSLICLAFLCQPLQAANKDTFFVGIGDASSGQTYPVNGSKYQPLLDAVLSAFSLEEGIEVEYVSLNSVDYDRWFNDSTIDFRFPDHPRWTAAKSPLFYSQPVVGVCETTRFLPQNQWTRVEDVTRLGVIKDLPVSREWSEQEIKGYTKIIRFDNTASMIEALLSHHVDGILTDAEALSEATKQLNVAQNQLVSSAHIPDKKSSLRISSEQYPAMLEKLDEFLKTHRGMIAQIARRHGLDNGRACVIRPAAKHQSELAD